MSESSVNRVYLTLRQMATDFVFKPGERINETALTTKMNVSRTPLREALNRLVAEGFLTFVLGKGFFCRPLSPNKILELYQLRCALETEAVVRAIENATTSEILDVVNYLNEVEKSYVVCTDLNELLRMDEEFHQKLAALSGNEEILKFLAITNERIRYVRIINHRQLRDQKGNSASDNTSMSAHRVILEAVRTRDTDGAVSALRNHIERRSEQTVELVRVAYSQLYVPDD
ncbi:GntR family transcriptional regulator [Pseudorhodobacter sp. W20_MBD10_FR17]|uniref:GntR family transcriptional regulator n=1 Tax=Pseudorhodobacter sp. W20_MBD10_FR17 TaxID=3240266 RepID=UPI003F996D65